MALEQIEIANGLLNFECPRCHASTAERLYGPCASCRAELGASPQTNVAQSPAGDAERLRFEPRMHVAPNHVATKDD